jgi:hypothetical protein
VLLRGMICRIYTDTRGYTDTKGDIPEQTGVTNPRSGCQHKAWGVSPKYTSANKPSLRSGRQWVIMIDVNRNRCRPLRGLNCFR